MLTTFLTVLPIFALVFAGWGARRLALLGPGGASEVNKLVVWLALPALLFDIMASADPAEIWKPEFILAFGAGCFAVFGGTLALRLAQGRGLADGSLDALNASYANTGYMGFPLALAVVGESGMGPTLIATILTVSVLFALAVALIECALQPEARPMRIALRLAGALARNPMLAAPALGAAVMALGLEQPAPLARFLDLLGAAASPCALVGLGLFLAGRSGAAADAVGAAQTAAREAAQEAGRRLRRDVGLLSALKLIVHPAATWAIASPLLGLPAAQVQMAVLLAALPTGTGPFMLAEFYGREAALTGRVVLVTTALSVLSVSAYLAWFWQPL